MTRQVPRLVRPVFLLDVLVIIRAKIWVGLSFKTILIQSNIVVFRWFQVFWAARWLGRVIVKANLVRQGQSQNKVIMTTLWEFSLLYFFKHYWPLTPLYLMQNEKLNPHGIQSQKEPEKCSPKKTALATLNFTIY